MKEKGVRRGQKRFLCRKEGRSEGEVKVFPGPPQQNPEGGVVSLGIGKVVNQNSLLTSGYSVTILHKIFEEVLYGYICSGGYSWMF